MNHKILGFLAFLAASPALADRMASPLLLGSGTSTASQIQFNQGFGANNSSITAASGSTGGTMTASAPNAIANHNATVQIGPLSNSGKEYMVVGGGGGPGYVLNSPGNYIYMYPTSSALNVGFSGSLSDSQPQTNFQVTSGGIEIAPTAVSGVQLGIDLFDRGSTGANEGLFMQWDTIDHTNMARLGAVSAASGGDLIMYANSSNSGTANERLRALGAGGVNISGTGGNTAHACTWRQSNATATSVTTTCNAGESITAGGCNASPQTLTQSYPGNTSIPGAWTCSVNSSTSIITYAYCCQI